ncbi:serine O-acetyltransferase EpsC [Chitinophagaceae bacterium LWZ2-11]
MSHKDFLEKLYQSNRKNKIGFPDKETAEEFIELMFNFLFDAYKGKKYEVVENIEAEYQSLQSHLLTLLFEITHNELITKVNTDKFFQALPDIYNSLLSDAETILEYDPAAQSIEEVVIAYPGFYAIAIYRLANQLWKQEVKLLPRVFSEFAHSKTGIDIHPGATIGENFFIDHGTGIVIGETAVIGDNVKIYQGVTLGALSSTERNVNERRHPAIEDDVIIYSGATILGPNTIGKGSVIGGNVWLTDSVPVGSLVYQKSEIQVKDKNVLPTALAFAV